MEFLWPPLSQVTAVSNKFGWIVVVGYDPLFGGFFRKRLVDAKEGCLYCDQDNENHASEQLHSLSSLHKHQQTVKDAGDQQNIN